MNIRSSFVALVGQEVHPRVVYVLVARLQASHGSPVDEHGLVAMQIEMLPFAQLPSDEGKQAIVEYVVWREYPAQADEAKVAAAIANASNAMGNDFTELRDLARKYQFAWARLAT